MAAKVKGGAAAGAAAGVKEVKDILKSGEGAVKAAAGAGVAGTEEKAEEEVVFDAEAEIQSILTKNPLTMFSKSYCPYCKRAKAVLASHTISPPPYILELDLDPNGPAIQSALAAHSGRQTVPQIFVGDSFLGGGDDVVGLERDGKFVGVIREKSAGKITIS
ncbi:thioredoxin-like protein [Saitoella complicata NRRL Y-17804]|nr:thioredoxin-like protein [Saitoella complicata NRRL Y-17804]ODQ49740.1 thioredoxin-like protein [Saitoella complicata NRRL Y-17804]